MGLFELKSTAAVNSTNDVRNKPATQPAEKAEQELLAAKKALEEAFLVLGKKYYESKRENAEDEFAAEMNSIKECAEKERLWNQYKLSLEGKMLCDNCNAVITSDSLFCNKCGTPVKQPDFSKIGIEKNEKAAEEPSSVCPSCGGTLTPGAKFCIKCGYKL